jgi:hypothetical protein
MASDPVPSATHLASRGAASPARRTRSEEIAIGVRPVPHSTIAIYLSSAIPSTRPEIAEVGRHCGTVAQPRIEQALRLDNDDMAGESRDRYVIEDYPVGRTLVVKGRWTPAATKAVQRPDVTRVVLNYASGYQEPDLSFIDAWPITQLHVLDRSISDLAPLARLGQTLEELSVEAAPDARVDLAALPHLRTLEAGWDAIRDTLYGPDYLTRLVTFGYRESDLEPLGVQPSLQTIQLETAPRLETLVGIERFPTLTSLRVWVAQQLHDLEPVESVRETLRELELQSCPAINDITPIAALAELRLLGINNCGLIRSIEAVGNLAKLEVLEAWESTRIEDGDLSPLLRLPRLKEIRMRDRRDYRPRLKAVENQLGIA